jgi:hypothetical protein
MTRHEDRPQTPAEAVLDAIRAKRWLCSDGHKHPRPETFTQNRLIKEVDRRCPRNPWPWSEIALAVWEWRDAGLLLQDARFRLRVNSVDYSACGGRFDRASRRRGA